MDWYLTLAAVLIGCGVVLLAAEFFLPTGGFLVVGGIVGLVAAVGLIMYYGTTREAIVAVIGLCVGLPIAWAGLVYAWKSMALPGGLESDAASATVASTPEFAEMEALRGRHGKTITPMRPSGTVEIDGRRVDAITEGMMLDAGVWVKCVDVKPGKVTVRAVEKPADLSNLNLEFGEPT